MNKVSKKLFSQLKNSAVIVHGKRTPIGCFMGNLKSFKATDLGSYTIKANLQETKLSISDIDEVIMGNVLSSGLGQAPARITALKSGLSSKTICTTVNKVCASGMKSITMASQNIELGHSNTIIAGGMESMSNAPHLVNMRGFQYGENKMLDSIQFDGLSDGMTLSPMGNYAEKTVKDYKLTREEQDKYCMRSYENALKTDFSSEIVGLEVKIAGKSEIINKDEELSRYKPDKISKLNPAFEKNTGTITAANSSKISDGACTLVVMNEQTALSKGLKPLVRIIGYVDHEIDPVDFSICPSLGIKKLLQKYNFKIGQINAFEINEAFSSVARANIKELQIDENIVNIRGGAVSLGHPIGASGARIVLSLINSLGMVKGKYGIASICNGGGGSTSILVENLRV